MIGRTPFTPSGRNTPGRCWRRPDGLPLLIPALAEELRLDELVARLDGLVFTGSPSNVEPHHYEGPASHPGTLHDPARDATTLPLIRKAVQAGVPVLGICRGFQEINVAFGGSLHQRVHEVAGHLDHRDDESQPLEVQYGPAHEVILQPGGMLHSLAGTERARVNSLHWQGIERLGDGPGGGGARAGRIDRSIQSRGRGAVCARGSVASRVEGDGQRAVARACFQPSAAHAVTAPNPGERQSHGERDPSVLP